MAPAVAHWALPRTFFPSASAPGSRPGPQVSGRRRSGRALPGRGTARGAVAPRSAAQAGRAGWGQSASPGGRVVALRQSRAWVRRRAARGRGAPRAFEAFQVTGRVRAVSGLGDF